MASDTELSEFLKSVERRAFKRCLYHLRDEEAALDVVQDSMMKLAQHYGDKPPSELPLLFQRILTNCMQDWFRRQKTRQALFSSLSDFEASEDSEILDFLPTALDGKTEESVQDSVERAQILQLLENLITELPDRQREAFLMRYWEEMDVAETAAVMGCSQGSVKTHCFRAVQALSKALKARGFSA